MVENLWRMSIYGTVLILVVLAVRLFLQKYPKVYSYSLWITVLIRLLCPVFLTGSYSFQPDLKNIPYMYVYEQTDDGQRILPYEKGTASDTRRQAAAAWQTEYPVEAQRAGTLSRMQLIRVVYLAGVCITAAVFLAQLFRLKKRISAAVSDGKNIWLCDEISSAFVMGVIHPRIYLPCSLTAAERWYVVRHEETHIRHGDPWIQVCGTAACCLHWWNPFVWYAVYKLHQDMEMCCDEAVMEEASLPERKTYAAILLNQSVKQSGLKPLAFNESNTEKRVRNILNGRKKRTIFLVVFFSLFMVFCGGAFMTVPRGTGGMGSPGTESEQGMNMVNGEYSPEEMPVYLEQVILSDTPVNSRGLTGFIQLVMTEGEYFTEEYAGAGGGVFPENYRGIYELRVLDENREEISRYLLQDEFGGIVFHFGDSFALLTEDYNADGCVDFTLGTWGSSSMGLYYLYTLLENGEIMQAYPEAVADLGFAFSKRFETAEPGFVTCIYNNATGEYGRVLYRWEKTQGIYVREEEQPISSEEAESAL